MFRQAEEPKQLVDEASRFHLGRQHSAVICCGALLFSSRVLRPSLSLVTLCSHKSGRCAAELYSTVRLISGSLHPFYTSPMASSALQHRTASPIRRKAAADKLVEKIVKHDSWPIQPDILSPPLLRLTSRKPLWLDFLTS